MMLRGTKERKRIPVAAVLRSLEASDQSRPAGAACRVDIATPRRLFEPESVATSHPVRLTPLSSPALRPKRPPGIVIAKSVRSERFEFERRRSMKPGSLVKQSARKFSTIPSEIPAQPTPSHEEIEVRAYEIFLERGAEHGHDFDDWLQAQQELSQVGSGLRKESAEQL